MPPSSPNPTDPLAQTLASTAPDPVAAIASPSTDRFESLELLGRGGMGEVRLWRDRRIGREVAVKIARPGLGAEGQRRFAREALIQARLEHPAFVPVYDVATDAGGAIHFHMKRVRGRTLRAILAEQAKGGAEDVTRHRLLAAFVQICLAVDYAHARGVVHRDIKPENVMLGDFGEIHLLDWGVAKTIGDVDEIVPADPTADTAARGTREGSVLGTIGYMPPEQLRGEHATLDGRADVYALGCVLFEILTLEPLHRGSTFADLVASTMDAADRSPAARAPSRDIAPELDAIVVRAVRSSPADRFPSARALGDAIERYLDGDREAALRRERAKELASAARAALDGAGDDVEKRVAAGRDAARAVALDPAQPEARRALLDAIAAPAVVPAAALAGAEEARVDNERKVMRDGAGTTFLIKLMLLPVFLFVVELFEPTVAWSAWGIGMASGVALLVASRPRAPAWVALLGIALMCLENAIFTRWSSPYVVQPMIAIATGTVVCVYAPARSRSLRFAMCLAVVLVPAALELTGVTSSTFSVSETGYHVAPSMGSPLPLWVLLAHFVVVALSTGLGTFNALDRAREVELRARSQSWMLERVLDPS